MDRNHVILRLKNIFTEDIVDNGQLNEAANKHEKEKDSVSSHIFQNDLENEIKQNKKGKKSSFKMDAENYVTARHIDVEIDLALSAYANARNMYISKKAAQLKETRTIEAAKKAIGTVEKQAAKLLQKQNIVRHLRSARKVHWFEKFNWYSSYRIVLII